MSLYPSLEDMKVDKLHQAQAQVTSHVIIQQNNAAASGLPYNLNPAVAHHQIGDGMNPLYPTLNEYMGIEFTQDVIAANMPEYLHSHNALSTLYVGHSLSMVAPLSGSDVGLKRAELNHGIRELVICKDGDHKVGLRVKNVDKGIFVCLVKKNSPASLARLRFGDQILQINETNLAGYSVDKVHDLIKKSPENGIKLAVRDRPFERTITMHKDSTGHIGFQFSDGEITALIKDSSAARNGLLINHHLLEVNGQNVVGLKDKEVTSVIVDSPNIVTITVMPSFIYRTIIKNMGSSLMTKLMDHSVSDL